MGLAVFVTLAVCLPIQGVVVNTNTSLEEPVTSEVGGRTVLVQELTATWCPSCAEIDPELVQVADSHGSRIALVALHPSDGEDAFQPPAAQHRIERLKLTYGDALASTPTFVVEDGPLRIGYDAWRDVQRDILDAEVQRQSVSELEFQVVQTNDGLRVEVVHAAPVVQNNTQLTFLVLEHGKLMPEGFANPGEATRDRVVIGASSCDLNTNTITELHGPINASVMTGCVDDFAVTFPQTETWSIVLVHEYTTSALENGSSTESLGVVELAYRDRAVVSDQGGLSTVLIGAVVLLALAAILPKK